MLSSGKNRLLTVTDEQMDSVRISLGATRQSLQSEIDTLVEWYSTQLHLPQRTLDRDWLERLLILNKLSLEKVKQIMDTLCATRITMPEYFRNRDPVKYFRMGRVSVTAVPLAKLSTDNTRVVFVNFMTPNAEFYDFNELLKGIFMLHEYRQHHDYSAGDRYVSDFRNHTFRHFLKSNPLLIKKGEYVFRKVFGHRIAGVHILSSNPFMNYIVAMLKLVLTAKLAERISVHKTVDSLHQAVPRHILPSDYGGDEKPLEKIIDDWQEELSSERQLKWFKDLEQMTSDQSHRK